MMSLRIVFVALALVCAAQAYAVEYDVSQVDTYAASGVYDKVIAMLEKARERVKELDKELKDAVDTAYEKVQAAADKQTEIWYSTIQKAVEEAGKYGVDVSECITENHALRNIVHKMVKDSRKCIAAQKPTVQKVQEELDNVLEVQQHLMEAIKIAMEECKGLPLVEAIRCNLADIAVIGPDAARILAYTGKVAAQVTVQTAKSANNVRVCVNGVSFTAGKAAKQVVDKTVLCIREKVQGNKPLALY